VADLALNNLLPADAIFAHARTAIDLVWGMQRDGRISDGNAMLPMNLIWI
jgi:hypothetical protein